MPPGFTRARIASGVIAALFGMAGTAGMMAIMNGRFSPPKPAPDHGAVAFDPPPPKKPPPKRPKPKPKPKPRKPAAPPPPMPIAGAGLSGMSFGLSGLQGALDDATQALIGDVGDVVMTEDAVDEPPRPTQRVAPEYPVRARAKGITGHVTLSLLVGSDGALQDVRVLESRPAGVFDDAAIASVRQWRFDPATYQGRPVTVRARQTLRFELE